MHQSTSPTRDYLTALPSAVRQQSSHRGIPANGSAAAPPGKQRARQEILPLRGIAIAALQIEETPTFEEVKQEAEAAYGNAVNLLPAIASAEAELQQQEKTAQEAAGVAQQAEANARELSPRAEESLREARRATAELQNQHEEISSTDLRTLAVSLLQEWKTGAQPDAFQEAADVEIGIAGIGDAVLIAHTAAAIVDRRQYLLAAIIVGERFPEGALESTALHWGCSGANRGSWNPPPPGWHTLPPVSHAAGRAWQTPLGAYLPVIRTTPVASDPAYGVVLQLPMEGVLQQGGALNFVLKRPRGVNPEWLQGSGNKDFRISLDEAFTAHSGLVGGPSAGKQQGSPLDTTEARWTTNVQRWVHREEGVARPDKRSSTDQAGGQLLQQYKAAVDFLQSIFNKANERGEESATSSVEEEYRKAKQMLSDARGLIEETERAKEKASIARDAANNAARAVEEAQERVNRVKLDSLVALRSARSAAARLSGREQEVGLLELHQIAEARLKAWLSWVASRRSLEGREAEESADEGNGFEVSSFRMHGIDGWLSACATLANEGGRRFAVVSLAAAEAFPDGVLDGVVAHWGVAGVGCRGGWESPPSGWLSDPDINIAAGGGATESQLERVSVPGQEHRTDVAAHALTLQLPLEGAVGRGGIKLVLRTKDEQWLGCSFQGSRHDFFISLQKFGDEVAVLESDKQKPTKSTSAEGAESEASVAEKEASLKDKTTTSSTASSKSRKAYDPQPTTRQPVSDDLLDSIAKQESKAERSLMHRFNIAHDLLSGHAEEEKAALVAVATWLRFSAMRLLTWNCNYNVKPREISAAQERLTNRLAEVYESQLELRSVVRVALAAVGRGGQGDVGQRIRDEILHVQSRNSAKGGMIEEWHQKLHNNTSPDDVVICEALIAYIQSGLDISVYWSTLKAANITRERLASFDRAIKSEPSFKQEQCEGLLRDLKAYLVTLKAVHSGEDLAAAANAVLGYKQESVKSKTIEIPPVPGVSISRLETLVESVLPVEQRAAAMAKQTTDSTLDMSKDSKESKPSGLLDRLKALLAARHELQGSIQRGNAACGNRLRDVLFLDIALESALRQAVETEVGNLCALLADGEQGTEQLVEASSVCLQNAAQSLDSNVELQMCCRAMQMAMSCKARVRLLRLIAACDRLRRHLGTLAEATICEWQPTADALGARLSIEPSFVDIFGEEILRSTAVAPLSQLISALEPALRKAAGLGSWQLISPSPQGSVKGSVQPVSALSDVQGETYGTPTVLLARSVGGDEDIPEGVVAVITGEAPDVLSHAAVRARNCGVLLAACYEEAPLQQLKRLSGQSVRLTPSKDGGGMEVTEAACDKSDPSAEQETDAEKVSVPQISRKEWCKKFAVSALEFSAECVGAKSLNTVRLRGKLPDWIQLPASIALPFGSFEAVLQDPINTTVLHEVHALSHQEHAGGLEQIRAAVKRLHAVPALRQQLAAAFEAEGLPPLSESVWKQSWDAITTVWASKWNERAVSSLRKAGLDHGALQMAVLCQQVVPASYAFVAHTRHPTTGDPDVMYVEVVQGLGETLVSNTSGAAFRFTARKGLLAVASAEDSEKGEGITVVGYPSKSSVLMANGSQPGVIFRSDSNGEDLEGYAGAGLFNSVQAHRPQLETKDDSADKLLFDVVYQHRLLCKIAAAALAIEQAMGCPQDIEGVIDGDDNLHVVQTRPQM